MFLCRVSLPVLCLFLRVGKCRRCCPCLFGVPLPVPWLISCVKLTWAGFDRGIIFEISEGEKNSEECQYVLVDKKQESLMPTS